MFIFSTLSCSVQLVARNRQSRTEVEFSRSVQLVARIKNAREGNQSCIKMHATHEIVNIRKGLNNVPCVIHSCNKLHATGNYARDVSVVHKNTRDNMGKTPGCANVKQCKLKAWGVAVVDLWLFFEYHAEVKV